MPQSQPIKVLMIDDDEDDFLIVRDLLSDADHKRYELTWMHSYDDGLKRVCEGSDDVVLIDYRLGKGDGIGFVTETVQRNCKAPLILLTGQDDREIDLAAMRAGAADFLPKTNLTSDLLERAIRYAVAQKRSEEQRLNLLAERSARAELEAAAKAKDEFLAVLSHELRTPLTPVLLSVSSLAQSKELPESVRQELTDIRRNVELEVKLIDDLLDLTRITRGKLELRESHTDVHALLRHAWDTCAASDERAHALRITWDLQAGKCGVWGDSARIEQVFWNLFKNAIKFTPAGGGITVESRNVESSQIQIRITDTGKGIEADKLSLIFNAFEQINREVTRKFGGLGLGLAICKAIVTLHGGIISGHSAGCDLGASFTVVLPCSHTTVPQNESGVGDGATHTPPQSLNLLIVEDNKATLRIISRLFQNLGYKVTTADDVKSARQAARAGKFDLVVSDLGLPDGSGLELMRSLRDHHNLRGIALSGYGMEQDIIESKQAGFTEHLVKPIDFASLEAAVRRVGSKI